MQSNIGLELKNYHWAVCLRLEYKKQTFHGSSKIPFRAGLVLQTTASTDWAYLGGVVGLGGSGSCLNQRIDDNMLGEISIDG